MDGRISGIGSGSPGHGQPAGETSDSRTVFPGWLWMILFGVAYFLFAFAGDLLSPDDVSFVTFWLPSGLFVAGLLLARGRQWPWLVAGAILGNVGFDVLYHGRLWYMSLLFTTGNSLEAITGALLVRRFVGRRLELSTVREVLGLTFWGAVVGTVVSAVVGAGTLFWLGGDKFGHTFLTWWSGDAMGVLIGAPLILTLARLVRSRARWRWSWKQGEVVLFLAVLIGCSAYVFYEQWHPNIVLRYLVFPLLVLAALRYGAHGLSIANLVVGVVASWCTLHGLTEFAPTRSSTELHNLFLQLFLAVIFFGGLLLAAIVAEHAAALAATKAGAAALRASEEKFRALATNTPDLIVMQDKELRYAFVLNPQLGLTVEGMIGKTDYEIGLSPKDAENLTRIKKSVLAGKATEFMVVPLANVKGETEYFEGAYTPRYDANGNVDGLIGYFRNITARKATEAKILAYQGQLRDMAMRLDRAQEYERRKIAVDLHDQIGQNLAALRVRLQLLRRAGLSPEALATLEESLSLLTRMGNDSRTLAFHLCPPLLEELGLPAALGWLTDEFNRDSRGLRFFLEAKELGTPLETDLATALFYSTRELFTNAVKHSRAAYVTVSISQADGEVRVRVGDDGVGMDVAAAERAAENRSGFGLFGIRERLRYFGGRLEIESKPDEGAVFTMIVPVGKSGISEITKK